MADGRMLRKTAAADRRLAQLSPHALNLFLLSIPFLDREGRMAGSPVAVRGTVAPALAEAHPPNWTDDLVAGYIAEWTGTTDEDSGLPRPLVLHYCSRGIWVCQFVGFKKNQNLRWDRERPSSLPAPPVDVGDSVSPNQMALDAVPVAQNTARWQPPGGLPSQAEVEVQAQNQTPLPAAAQEPRAREAQGRPLEHILGMFEEIFGTPARLADARRERLVRAVQPLSEDFVRALFVERKRGGATPRSIAWFLPALEERAAEVRAGLRRDEDARGRAAGLAPEARVERWWRDVGSRVSDDDFEDVLTELDWPGEMRDMARQFQSASSLAEASLNGAAR